MNLSAYIKNLNGLPETQSFEYPWEITDHAEDIIRALIKNLDADYKIENEVAIHKSATVESYTTLKGPIIIGPDCFVASGAYLRGGVFLEANVKVGPSCEVKSSFVFANSALAHFNFIGNSIMGSDVNFEAGSITANYYNEREDKTIVVKIDGAEVAASAKMFGSVVGDGSKIGANAVLSPGTMLPPGSVVARLKLIS